MTGSVTLACACGAPITRQSKTGRCRACVGRDNAADPAWRAAQRAGAKAKMAEPEHRARQIAKLVDRNRNPTPAMQAAQRERGRHNAKTILNRPDMRALVDAPEMKAANGRKRTDTTLVWCPPELRDTYRYFKRTKRMVAAEARAAVEEIMAAERRRADAAMTPFERQMARVRAGARLVDKFVPTRADPAFTLGGVTPEAM